MAQEGVGKSTLAGMVRLARPGHWIKNVFVLLPIPFALAARSEAAPFQFEAVSFVCGLLGFCLLNSAAYTLNDLLDAEADRLHPRKRLRPIAAGQVAPPLAAIQSVVLALAALALGLAAGKATAISLFLVYLVVNLVYSGGAKRVALLDVFLLSSGFVIRVLLGCTLVGVAPSAWLLLCTWALALFLAFAKRRADLMAGLDHNHRPSLRGYNASFLDQANAICAGVAILAYALYSIESKILIKGREMASLPFVAYGILNYLRLADTEGAGGSPVEIAYTSRATQLCAAGWIAAVTWSLGLW